MKDRCSWISAALVLLCCPVPASGGDGDFDAGGVKIHYVTAGEGEPVVLIHGWMADSSMWGRDWAGNTRLDTKRTPGFRLIALDCRGHGKSDKPRDPAKYGAEMAADVVRLLDHLQIESAHLIGYSSGAFIAGKVAASHPERVRSLVFAGQAPLVAGVRVKAEIDEVEVFAKAVAAGGDLGAYIIAVTPPGKPKPDAEQAKAIADFLYGGKDVEAFAVAGRSFGELEVTVEQLAKCPAPMLFIHGSNESDVVLSRVAAVRQLLGRGALKVVAGGDHISTLGRREFTAAVVEFLRAAADPTRPPAARPERR